MSTITIDGKEYEWNPHQTLPKLKGPLMFKVFAAASALGLTALAALTIHGGFKLAELWMTLNTAGTPPFSG